MGSEQKPHAVFVPFPAHGHVAPHMQLARVLHARGFHVTLVHTELHFRRLERAKGAEAAAASAATWYDVEVIPDGLSLEAPPTTLEGHHDALERNCLEPFKELLRALANRAGVPPVSCVVADSPMMFASLAARDVGVPDVTFFTASACGLMGYMHFQELVNRGIVPLKKGTTVNVSFLDEKNNVLPKWWFGSHNLHMNLFKRLCLDSV
jgi:cyanohydrin beta-glucosyltransferase